MLVGACNVDSVTNPEPQRPLLAVNIVSGPVGSGNFTNTILPGNTGRATGAFWDNNSADEINGATQCNAGFYAIGTMSPACDHQAPGSTANQGGFVGGKYLGTGAGDRGSSDFMFNNGTYTVTLLGSYAGATSIVGWYTKTGSTYTFHPVGDWGNKQIGHSEVIDPTATGGNSWGFFIQNSLVNATGACDQGGHRSCSDATGGFATNPFNQFALFQNQAADKYLVGTEDNLLNLIEVDPPRDSDYNDYIFSVTPTIVGQGCTVTQGFWKTHGPAAKGNNTNEWPVTSLTLGNRSYTAAELQSIFDAAVKGNGLISLAHQLIAAKLNIADGASAPTAVLTAIGDADALIGNLVVPPVGNGSLAPSVTSTLTGILGGYNEGDTGPGHCGSEQVTPLTKTK
jgi:hypothetical protein